MATSKGRSGGSKSAPAKKSGGSKAPSKAAASRGGKATAAKKSTGGSSARGGASSGNSRGGATRAAGTGTKATATKSAGRTGAATASRGGSSAGRGAASKSATASRGAATKSTATKSTAARSSAASSRKAPQQRTDGRPLSANDLEKAFKDLLKDIYYAEKKLKTALGKMSRAAEHADVKEAFTVHQGQTEEQISKLEDVFEMLGMKAIGKKCAAMDGLLEEGDEHIEEYEKGPGRDAALIVGAQKVEHYEMAAYGSLRNFANVIGETEAAGVFEEILQQETDTDELLTTLSDTINRMAYGAHNDQGSEEDSDSSRSKSGRGNNAAERSSGSSGSSRSATANASRQADKDMEGDDEGDSNNRGTRDDSGEISATAGSDDTGKGRRGSSLDGDAATGSNR